MPEGKSTRQARSQSEPWGAACAAFVEGNQQAVTRWMRALFALSQEIAQFTQNRLQEDAAAWSALAACRNPNEAIECQRRFTAKAAEQYYDEIAKLSQIMIRAAGDGFSALQRPPSANA